VRVYVPIVKEENKNFSVNIEQTGRVHSQHTPKKKKKKKKKKKEGWFYGWCICGGAKRRAKALSCGEKV
jgi:hypothetical protein